MGCAGGGLVSALEESAPGIEGLAHVGETHGDGAVPLSAFTLTLKHFEMEVWDRCPGGSNKADELAGFDLVTNGDEDAVLAHVQVACQGPIIVEYEHPVLVTAGSITVAVLVTRLGHDPATRCSDLGSDRRTEIDGEPSPVGTGVSPCLAEDDGFSFRVRLALRRQFWVWKRHEVEYRHLGLV